MGPRHKCTVPSIGPLLRFAIEALMPEHFGFGADRDMHFAAVTCSLQPSGWSRAERCVLRGVLWALQRTL